MGRGLMKIQLFVWCFLEADVAEELVGGALEACEEVADEGADHPGGAVAPGRAFGARPGGAGLGVAVAERGLAIGGDLVGIQQHGGTRGGGHPGLDGPQVADLLLVARVRAVEMVAPALPTQLVLGLNPQNAGAARPRKLGHHRPQPIHGPATPGLPVVARFTPEELQQAVPLRLLLPDRERSSLRSTTLFRQSSSVHGRRRLDSYGVTSLAPMSGAAPW